jgi:hypothetical protein
MLAKRSLESRRRTIVNNIGFALQPFEIGMLNPDRRVVQHSMMFTAHRTMTMREPLVGAGHFEAYGAAETRTLISTTHVFYPTT